MKAAISNIELNITHHAELEEFIRDISTATHAEVWLQAESTASLCILKSHDYYMLMYQKDQDDVGMVSSGSSKVSQMIKFILENGQVDEYPQNCCVESSIALQAITYFFLNSGAKCSLVEWQI